MRQFVRRLIDRVVEKIAERTVRKLHENAAASGVIAEQVAQRVVEHLANNESAGGLAQALTEKISATETQLLERFATCEAELTTKITNRVLLELILQRRHERTSHTGHELFGHVSDDFWFWLNTEGYRASLEVRQVLPVLPDEATQTSFVGLAGDAALAEAFAFYRLCKRALAARGDDLTNCRAVLDFGVGWGRIIRFFLKDLDADRIWGIDSWDRAIDLCQRTNRWCHFAQSSIYPPTQFADDTFDLIYSFSVFSHLPEDVHRQWLVEFQRILRPGGLLVATTREREFMDLCEMFRNGTSCGLDSKYEEALQSVFVPTADWHRHYDSGRFCFAELGWERYPEFYLNGAPHYGEACIPRDYVLKEWTRYFSFVDYIDDRQQCSQNAIVVRKAPVAARSSDSVSTAATLFARVV